MKKFVITVKSWNAWEVICDRHTGPRFAPGDQVRIDPGFKDAYFYQDKTFRVLGTKESKWNNYPADQFVDLEGIDELYLNTMLIKN